MIQMHLNKLQRSQRSKNSVPATFCYLSPFSGSESSTEDQAQSSRAKLSLCTTRLARVLDAAAVACSSHSFLLLRYAAPESYSQTSKVIQ